MALFSIYSVQDLGMSHSGSEFAEGDGVVELSDEEVQTLVQLIREKNTTDVEELGIEASHPEIFDKLDAAYRQAVSKTEEIYWLREAFADGDLEWDDDLMDYCKEHCGYEFKYDEAEYQNEDGELDEDQLEECEWDNFQEWLHEYVDGLSDTAARTFFYDHMNAAIDIDDIEYTVEIPEEIVVMARNK